jgi:TolA-binding protein
MTAPDGSKGRRALAALSELVRDSVRPPTPAQLDSGLDAIRARLDGEPPQRARRATLRWSFVGALAVTAAVVALGVVRSGRLHAPGAPPAMAYRIEGGNLVDGGYLRESGRAGVKLFFAEGTEFILMPGTRSRLRAVEASGARIAIEHGTASFQVTPSADHRWQVDVGPFLVTVTGTVFAVSWDSASERFELKLRHGRVTVSGPVTGGEIALRAGQRLLVNLAQGETLISERKPEEAFEPAVDPVPRAEAAPAEPSVPSDRPAVTVGRPTTTPARGDGERRWAVALAGGQLDRIIAEAERAGVKATLDRASSDDLMALADAARYRRRMDLAREALLAERRRFPDSPRALDAAFLLGRVEEARDGGFARAIEWYDEYLKRAPAGTYASEALGRKMTLTSKLEGASQARPVAEEYLRRFPNGTYAGPARAFVRGP